MYNTNYCKKSSERIDKLAGYMQIRPTLPNVIEVNSGMILPRRVNGGRQQPYQGLGGVITSEQEFIKESVIYDLKIDRNVDRVAFGGKYYPENCDYSERVAVYLGLAHAHWGHFLIDIVQRCWYPLVKGLLGEKSKLYINYSDSIKIPDDYVFAFSGFGDDSVKFYGNCEAFFKLLGLDTSRIVFVNNPTQFRNVIVPDVAVYPGEYICSIYREIFDIVIENGMMKSLELKPRDKVYFSREHLHDSKDIGEKSIEDVIQESGYEILYPEELSLSEQIFYWQTTKYIACINGTIPHNCVFSKSQLKLTIFNKMHSLVGYQFTMDAVHGISPLYVDACYEPFSRYPLTVSRGPFWITVTEDVARYCEEELNIKIPVSKKTFSIWYIYLKQCLITEIKYQLRGSKAKFKSILKLLDSIGVSEIKNQKI